MPSKRSKSESLLTIFYRNPELGKVKPRLAAEIGEAKAFSIHLLLCEHTIGITEKLAIPKAIYYSDYVDQNDNWANTKFQKHIQTGFDIGEKMANAFRLGFESGHKSICIIGTDCFDLTSGIINEAFRRLLTHDVVIGPANDDCYYLLGMNYFYPDLFKDKDWSTKRIFADTLHTIKLLGLSCWELEPLNYIFEEKDLPVHFRV
jgi:rSAM/selenodomain-associated transferase 1